MQPSATAPPPDYLWQALPGYAVLRHRDSGKWYGLIMDVPRNKLGLPGPGRVDVLEVKGDPVSGGSVMGLPGILPAYHMAKGSWLSVLLDGSVPPALVFALLDGSYNATAPAQHRSKPRDRGGLDSTCQPPITLIWRQPLPRALHCAGSSGVKAAVGDIVYLYVTAPVCAVLYRCRVVRADIPWHYDDDRIRTERGMDLELQQRYAPDFLPREKLQSYGVRAVRGARHLPHRLACLLEEGCKEL